jgi:hypothetical protein
VNMSNNQCKCGYLVFAYKQRTSSLTYFSRFQRSKSVQPSVVSPPTAFSGSAGYIGIMSYALHAGGSLWIMVLLFQSTFWQLEGIGGTHLSVSCSPR